MKVSQVPFNIDLFKSNATSSTKEGVIDYEIGGYISSEKLDAQDERIIQKGIDFHTYKDNRRLKWEHGNSPAVNIGFVTDIELRKGRAYMTARIYAKPGTPQYKTAQEVVGDIENIFAFNKSYPKTPKALGFSVEGGKLAKTGKDVTRSIVTNVVLTTCPINTDAAVDYFKDSSSALLKSFIAGSEVLPQSETPALRPEHLDGNLSNHNIKSKMKNIKSKDEAVAFFKSQGRTEDEAKVLADTWETENSNRQAISKSLNDAVEKLQQSITDNTALGAKVSNTDFVVMAKSFKDSLTPDAENRINPANVIAEATNMQIELAKSQIGRDAEVIKSNGLVLESMKGFTELMKSFVSSMDDVKDNNASVIEFNEKLAKSIAKVDGGVSTENLEAEATPAETPEKGRKEAPAYTREQVVEALQKSAMQAHDKGDRIQAGNWTAKLTKAQIFNYEYNELTPELKSDVAAFFK